MTPAEARYAQKQSFPKTQLDLRHTAGCEVLPNRTVLLQKMGTGGVYAEVGVAFGDYTREIVAASKPRKLYLLDLWEGERLVEGLKKIRSKFAQSIRSGRIEIVRGISVDSLKTLPDNHFDWIYIDTDHSYSTTFEELKLAALKVKQEGYIAGHDFCTGNVVAPVPYGVVEACSKFVVDFGWRYRYLTLESDGHFSFALQRIA